ncbi:MAG: iron-containing alcohol dehydrogenase [Bacteroidales bacterium]|jgi:NADP-dependent alcohol dehydrogenase|nr:iron-containing alcohol dehydrogenase [Bacteroidales bacterium]
MNNFTFCNPVKIIFGKDTISKLSKELSNDSKVMIIYGGGSIKNNGVYDQVINALTGHKFVEFSGIEPNPHYETCIKCADMIRRENVDFLLAVGGGSVIDATKFIAAAALYDGDAWDIMTGKGKIIKAMPFGTVLTLPATGSEMNSGSVITKASTQEKFAFNSTLVFPKFSVLDPETTFSLPPKQIANGIIDTFVHVMEQYLTYNVNAKLQDYFAESILKVLIEEGSKVFENPYDYDIRANLMWASTWGLNGWIAKGVAEDWSTHMIGHELTALHGIDHGQTLAIVLPGVMGIMKDDKEEKILQLGERVFNITEGSNQDRIIKTIDAVDNFFQSLGIKTRLTDYNVGKETIDSIVKRFEDRNWALGEKGNITPEVVREILIKRM